jgi:hypothetical protein
MYGYNVKLFFINKIVIFLCMLCQWCLLGNTIKLSSKHLRVEIIDYRTNPDDILFWIHAENTPVVAGKLIDNGIYPLFVTVYNTSPSNIKIIKTALGGLALVDNHDISSLYCAPIQGAILQQILVSSLATLAGIKLIPRIPPINSCFSYIATHKYMISLLCGLASGVSDWSVHVEHVTQVEHAFKSHSLSEESIIHPGCCMRFLLLSTDMPSQHTLKIPVFNEQDSQISCVDYTFV